MASDVLMRNRRWQVWGRQRGRLALGHGEVVALQMRSRVDKRHGQLERLLRVHRGIFGGGGDGGRW